MKRSLLSVAAALALAATSSAQMVTFLGQVEDVQGTANQFFVDCTDISISSATVNLNALIGQQVELTGMWNGSVANPAVAVTAAPIVPESFGVGGSADLGGELNFDVSATPGQPAILFASANSAFIPFGNDVLQIDIANAIVVGSGIIPGNGNLQVSVPVPNQPSLVGRTVFGQGAWLDTLGAIRLTNSDCKEIKAD